MGSQTTGKISEVRSCPLLSRRQIEGMIAEGHAVFIVDQCVIKGDAWLKYHPGGDKSILHMVGRDATDEVTVLHSPETKKQMLRYRVGKIEGRWRNFLPPIQGGRFRPLIEAQEDDEDEYEASVPDTRTTRSSSDASSRQSSPVFEADESTLRHRLEADSLSSAASSVLDEETGQTAAGFLDSETRKEISLDLDKYPSLNADTQDEIVRKYRLLNERIKAEGLYECGPTAYVVEIIQNSVFLCGMLVLLSWRWYASSAIFLGLFWRQLVFIGHDSGHMGVTHDFHIDSCIAIFIADFLGGLSMGWWKRNHNIHHIVTNHPEHDPDIEYMPIFAVSHRFLGNLKSTYYDRLMVNDAFAKVLLRIQAYTYYPIMLFARFNLYFLSWDHLLARRGPKHGPASYHWWLEMAGQVFFWTWFGYGILYKTLPTNWDRLIFILVSHMLQLPLHVQFTLSHFAMSTADLGPGESFPQKMLRTTMDIDCPTWLDLFHGGLQFQAIHHMYPRIPRHNLRRTQKLVQEFCDEVGIPYALYGFVDSNKCVVGKLNDVSRQAAIFAECQKKAAQHIF
ncbi:Fatty acid desaturase [Pleurostoma richardsiae]|uniref:Delta 8-(E)-sphingolipid desaturase n=1 Tax=Pleurostoma richardsiae TaxID=41990 RepID=A0AA38RMY0_9PEZI|nr:Fatty acid desaturase [Pleurostoma richardsiae]